MISAVNFNPYYVQTKSVQPKRQMGSANLDAQKNVSFEGALPKIFKKGKSLGEVISSIRLLIKDWQVGEYGLNLEEGSPIISKENLGKISLQLRKTKKEITGQVQKQVFGNERLKYSILKNKQSLADIYVLKQSDQIYIPYFTNELGRKKYRGLEKSLLQLVAEDFTNQGHLRALAGDGREMGKNKHSRDAMYKRLGAQLTAVPYIKDLKTATMPQEQVLNTLISLSSKDKLIFPQTKANLEKLCYNKTAQ